MKAKTYTIGFTKKNAKTFFDLLRNSSANHLIDVRLNNVSQLAGFAKQDDLQFFLEEILHWKYTHLPELAPTKEILEAYKKYKGDWGVYEDQFMQLMEQRKIEQHLNKKLFDKSCLLCSEHEPHHCHRKLVVEYLNKKWDSALEVVHLM
ncbi:MAG: DUF488 domain-containing protein [Deinococcales bacterium]